MTFYNSAIGPNTERCAMHVSGRDDSLSLLPISPLQEKIFSGTREVAMVDVMVSPLNVFIDKKDIVAPAMLKLDVQGFELDALRGCELQFLDLNGCVVSALLLSYIPARSWRQT